MSKCFTQLKNALYAITNWGSRPSPHDAMILHKMNDEQRRFYQEQKGTGRTDSAIFLSLFPRARPVASTIVLDVNLLSKSLLIELICHRLKTSLRTLDAMSLEDLRKLLVSLSPTLSNKIRPLAARRNAEVIHPDRSSETTGFQWRTGRPCRS